MTETVSLIAAERADVIVRDLRESDLTLADAILRSAFDTFTGVTSCSVTRTTSTPVGWPTPAPPSRPSETGSSPGPTS